MCRVIMQRLDRPSVRSSIRRLRFHRVFSFDDYVYISVEFWIEKMSIRDRLNLKFTCEVSSQTIDRTV